MKTEKSAVSNGKKEGQDSLAKSCPFEGAASFSGLPFRGELLWLNIPNMRDI